MTRALVMTFPDNWEAFDLDPETRDKSIDRMVRRGLGTTDQLAQLRRNLTLEYRNVADTASQHGAFLAATLATVIEDLPVSASFFAFLTPTPVDSAAKALESVEDLLHILQEPLDGESDQRLSVLELSVGTAVRLRATVDSGVTGTTGETAKTDEVRYFVPLTERQSMLLLSFSTPNLAIADGFAELFDALASTARLV